MQFFQKDDYYILSPFPTSSFIEDVGKSIGVDISEILEKNDKLLMFHKFFALEVYHLIRYINNKLNNKYQDALFLLKKYTWLKNYNTKTNISLNVEKLNQYHLLPHQISFVKKYLFDKQRFYFRGQFLAFEQGLGKTLTSISLFQYLEKNKVIILCPNSLQFNWKDELIKKANVNVEEVAILNIDKVTDKTKWLILNFEKIKKVPQNFVSANTGLIVDEAHYLKDLNTTRTRLLIEFVNENDEKVNDILLLSGTPLKGDESEFIPYLLILDKNSNKEVLKIFIRLFMQQEKNNELFKHIVMNRLALYFWRDIQANALTLPKKVIRYINVSPITDLDAFIWENIKKKIKKNILPFYLLKKKEYKQLQNAILQKIEKIDKIMYVKFLKYFHLLFSLKKVSPELKNYIIEKYSENKHIFTEEENKFMKNISHVKNVNLHIINKYINSFITQKRKQILEEIIEKNINLIVSIINEKEVKKILIMGTIVPPLFKLQNKLASKNIQSYIITGDLSVSERQKIVDKFKTDNVKVLIASIQTLGTGFTITEANSVLILNYPWRNADLEQAIARVYRYGQTLPVKINIFRVKTSSLNIHSHMEEIALQKKKLVQEIMDTLYSNQLTLYK